MLFGGFVLNAALVGHWDKFAAECDIIQLFKTSKQGNTI